MSTGIEVMYELHARRGTIDLFYSLRIPWFEKFRSNHQHAQPIFSIASLDQAREDYIEDLDSLMAFQHDVVNDLNDILDTFSIS